MKFSNPKSKNIEQGSIIIYTLLILIAVMVISITMIRIFIPKFRIANEAINSTISLYAADSAAEWCLYNHYKLNIPSTLEPGAIFHATLDEGSGSTVGDFSGSSNNGALNGAVWVSGRFGSALSFDGVDDSVFCQDSDCGGVNTPKLDMGLGRNWTATAWVKPDTYNTTFRGIVSKFDSTNDGWALGVGPAGHVFSVIRAGAPSPLEYSSPADGSIIPLGVWSHIAVTFNRNGSMVRYFNGVQTGTTMGIWPASSISVNHPYNFCLGARGQGNGSTWCNNRNFDGAIDDVRVFERQLSSAEIQAMVPTTAPPLVMNNSAIHQAYYPSTGSSITSCLESDVDYRLVGGYHGVFRSLEIFD